MDWARRNLKAGWEDGSYNVYHDIICPAVGKAAVGHYFMDEASGHWEDAGVPERYLASNMRLSSGQNVISHEASIHPAAQLEGCVVLGQTTIDGRATIRNAILSTQRGQLAITQVGAVSTDSRKDTECGKPLAAKSYLGIPA
ncbi:MAG TPA: hypothetical protein VM124_01135, partial [Candidatus Limnocylindrales bacterium]|nr:hypothetical protein [Candidatus Limnocylindrales bacterium]